MNYPPRSERSNSWKKPSRFSGSNSYNKGGFDRNKDRPMFKAVCSNCGSRCEVPFKPNEKKPVLCSDCFKKDDSGFSKMGDKNVDRTQFGDTDRGKYQNKRRFNDERAGFEVDCDDCGVRTTVPFKPNGKKLVFCRDCFDGNNNNEDSPKRQIKVRENIGNDMRIMDQLKAINLKLDTLMKLANKQNPPDELDTILE
ncbi:hypothetical protein IT408_01605 [Candidatus Uhrbacteria bacterium]|nr:hypothetical protein [Candidatus Uhrbacteria bacterium]